MNSEKENVSDVDCSSQTINSGYGYPKSNAILSKNFWLNYNFFMKKNCRFVKKQFFSKHLDLVEV